MDKQEISLLKSKFDELAHVDESTGIEFWYARELQAAFSYSQWRRFNEVIEKAKLSCNVSGNIVSNHFADVGKMVDLGSGATREIADVKLTRYACYLIAQNGDPRKEEIAFAQSYFAQQTRKQELIEEHMKNLQRLENRDSLNFINPAPSAPEDKRHEFNKNHFDLFVKFYNLKSNPDYCYKYELGKHISYSYSEKALNLIFEEIKKDPEHIIQSLKNTIKK